jgi:divalent metal cation (Fe/Co/Zn/Cd) transporter
MSEIIENDSLDRIIDIVRYVPQMVKVENVYTYSSQQNRKVEFHLRVLIKALLEEMEKVKKDKGIMFEIDEGVIGMIRS